MKTSNDQEPIGIRNANKLYKGMSLTPLTSLFRSDCSPPSLPNLCSSGLIRSDDRGREGLEHLLASAQLRDRELARARRDHEQQLSALSRQMMGLESSLRRRQKELSATIRQKDRVIREQACLIRFLSEKLGVRTTDVDALRREAVAKIPQVAAEDDGSAGSVVVAVTCDDAQPLHLTTIRVGGLTAILESASDDSDSAIILDDSVSSTATTGSFSSVDSTAASRGGRLSRSISDVVSELYEDSSLDSRSPPEFQSGWLSDPEGQLASLDLPSSCGDLRASLQRRGSFDLNQSQPRSKLRSGRTAAVASMLSSTGLHVHAPPTVGVCPRQANNHRSVTKPRDVKKRSNSIRVRSGRALVEKSGSVYRAVFADNDAVAT